MRTWITAFSYAPKIKAVFEDHTCNTTIRFLGYADQEPTEIIKKIRMPGDRLLIHNWKDGKAYTKWDQRIDTKVIDAMLLKFTIGGQKILPADLYAADPTGWFYLSDAELKDIYRRDGFVGDPNNPSDYLDIMTDYLLSMGVKKVDLKKHPIFEQVIFANPGPEPRNYPCEDGW